MIKPRPSCLQIFDRPVGRRWVIPDVHGYCQTLKTLVTNQIQLTKSDQLFLLGDYIDRGPDNAGVIDFILELQQTGYQVYGILGNHEDNLIHEFELHRQTHPRLTWTKWIEAIDLLDEHQNIHPMYFQWLTSLPYYIELDHFYLVHAGFRFDSPHPFTDYDAMLRIRGFQQNPTGKTIIHGHQPTNLNMIEAKIRQRNNIIPLDNGCYAGRSQRENGIPPSLWQRGKLLALELNSWQLLCQENIG